MSNGSIEIEWEQEKDQLRITLASNQFDLTQMQTNKTLFVQQGILLAGEIQALGEEKAVISYALPNTAIRLSQLNAKYGEVERLEIAQKLMIVTNWEQSMLVPFIHPDNLFLVAGNIVMAHRGLAKIVEPKEMTKETFLQQYKAITLTVIHPKYDYNKLVAGFLALKDAFSQQVIQATTVEEVQTIVSQQYQAMLEKRQQSERRVHKGRYQFFKWGVALFFLTTIGLGCSTYIFGQQQVPLKDRIIASEAAFISKDYDQATTELKEDNPKKLPASAQYVLAASYVNLDDLTNEQKEAVLTTLSQKSTTNELLFWIDLGQGNFEEALSVAQNIGDDQLIVYAYTKLYDATKANGTMSGAKKQKLLEEYQKEIDDYTKKVGGDAS